jgi:hypothetical protein
MKWMLFGTFPPLSQAAPDFANETDKKDQPQGGALN